MRASTSTTENSDFESTIPPFYNNERTTFDEELPTTSNYSEQPINQAINRLKNKREQQIRPNFPSNYRNEDSSRRQRSVLAKSYGYSIYFLLVVLLFSMLPTTTGRSVMASAKCYFFGPGTTIHGADYRRDYGVGRKECAEQCKSDVCCMGFEWVDERCTLKSRSLNGTITAQPDAYFGLCLDFDDSERDLFWDHELGGSVVSSKEGIDRESCSKMCGYQEDAIIYSWKALDEKNNDELGDCSCIGVLHSIRLSFGSASGFLM